MKILGVGAFHGEAAAALVVDGVCVAAAAEERFTRVKHDASFPRRAVRFCLSRGGLEAHDLDAVVLPEKPLRRFERVLACELAAFPRSWRTFPKSFSSWLGDRLWIKNRIASELSVPPSQVLFVERSRAQAAGAFYTSPFDEAAVLVVDGAAEWSTASLARASGSSIDVLAELEFPHSLELVLSGAAEFLGLGGAGQGGKVLALAGWGQPRFERELRTLVHLDEDGSFSVDLGPERGSLDAERRIGKRLRALLGEPREERAPLAFDGPDRRHADIAASVDKVLGDAILHLARELHRRVPVRNLCFAGALSASPAWNMRLLVEGPFERLQVPPAAGLGAAVLGAALDVEHSRAPNGRRVTLEHALLGEPVQAVDGASGRRIESAEDRIDLAARALAAGESVGWVQGRFEWGTRSLGARSLLLDPRRADAREHLSTSVKRREPFLPLACAVPEERARDLFELPIGSELPARFLLAGGAAKNAARERIPGALHADLSVRPQLVSAQNDPLFHRLLERFGELSGVPVLLQTSLNLRGDPIARGEADAVAVFERTRLGLLVVEDRVYERR